MKRLLDGVALFGVVGCGSDPSPTTPTPPPANFNGNWVGAVQDSVVGQGLARLTLTQSGSTVTGSYATSYPNPNYNGGGNFSGQASGSSISGTIQQSVATACPYTVNATLSGNTISGTYAAFNCTSVDTGTFSLTRT
jgi:hypothetical protein